jgi:hypothetical protein
VDRVDWEAVRGAVGTDITVVVRESVEQDGSGWGVFGQRFAASGAKDGPGFPVNTGNTVGTQTNPSVAVFQDDS